MATAAKARVDTIGGDVPTNSAAPDIAYSEPYMVNVTLVGTSTMILHRWQPDAVEEKARAAKGSKAKKTDNVESYVYRNDVGEICIPGVYLHQSIIHASKFRQDPRSPRKSAMDLMRAAIFVAPELASLDTTKWDYLDTRRVVVQRSGVNRVRPAMLVGWTADFQIHVIAPEYVSEPFLHDLVTMAGRLVGIADHRPTYGRFAVQHFERAADE